MKAHRYRPALECLQERCLPSAGFFQINLVSDEPGAAQLVDPHLVNPWGIAFSPTGPFWFADNGAGVSDILDGRGQMIPLVVSVPSGTSTGVVFNGGPGFVLSVQGSAHPARFLFATEDGLIAGWSGLVDPTHAWIVVDNSSLGAVFKGLALATDAAGQSFLLAADFGRGRIDVFDPSFSEVVRPGAFQDPNLSAGYAPFNIQNIGGRLFVTYALQNRVGHDDIAGAGHGFIDEFDADGNLLRRFASAGALNSPWGLALAPAGFGRFGGALLVGNNGDGRIIAFNMQTGAFLGPLTNASGAPIAIPGLWALTFGNGHAGGDSHTLFFTAGIDRENHGLFGAIQSPGRAGADTGGIGGFNPHAPGEPGDYPLPPAAGPAFRDAAEDPRAAITVLLPRSESSLLLIPTLSSAPVSGARVDGPASGIPVPVGGGSNERATTSAINSEPTAVGGVVSSATLFIAAGADAPATRGSEIPPRSLNSFLSLDPPTMRMENSALDVPRTEVSAAARPAGKSLVQLPSEESDQPQSAASEKGGQTESRGRRSRLALLGSLVVAVGAPVIFAAQSSNRHGKQLEIKIRYLIGWGCGGGGGCPEPGAGTT